MSVGGSRGITRREAEVLAALAERLTNGEIAGRLYVSERTIESHISSLLRKMGLVNRRELAAVAKSQSAAAAPRRLPAPLELLADAQTFVGRREQQGTLLALWDRAMAGEVHVAVVEGEEGIGKTRLVAEVARHVHESGVRVLLGSCFADSQMPYEPFVHILRSEGADAAAGTLTRLLPERHDAGAADTVADGPDRASGQTEVCGALYDYVCGWAQREPLLVVIEDIHWSTGTTRAAVRQLARVGGHVPMLCIFTVRNTQPELDDNLVAFLGDLTRYSCVHRVSLTGLEDADVGAMLRHLGGSLEVSVVASETGGNPLFVREMGAAPPASTGHSLAALVGRRYGLLRGEDLDVVDTAAVIGREFTLDLVAAASGLPAANALDALERAEAAGLVAVDPGHPGRFSFTHALVRTTRYEALPTSRRLTLHRDVARALAERVGEDQHCADLARHACIAAGLGDAEAALAYAVRAAEVAEGSFAFAEAAGHYRRALEVADLVEGADVRQKLELSIRLGAALHGAGDAASVDVLLDAAEIARGLDDATSLAGIVSAVSHFEEPPRPAWWYETMAGGTSFSSIVGEALVALGPASSPARARMMAAASDDLACLDGAAAAAMAEEAWDIAHALDDAGALGDVLLSYRVSGHTPDNVRARHPTADELVALGQQTGQRALTILGLSHRAWSHREQGELDAARLAVEEAYAVQAGRPLTPHFAAGPLMHQSALDALAGNLAAAEAVADRVWLIESATFDPTPWYLGAILGIRFPQGRLPEFVPLIESALDLPGGVGQWYRPALAIAYIQSGRTDDARDILEDLVRPPGSIRLSRGYLWLCAMANLATTAEWTRCPGQAATIGEQLEPFSGRIADLPSTTVASVDLSIAQTALTAGDPARAEHFAGMAVAASRSRGTPIFLGRELIRLAAARRARSSGDEVVRPLVAEALAIADQFNAPLIRSEAEWYELTATPTSRRA